MEISCSVLIGNKLPWEQVLPAIAAAGCSRINLATDDRGVYRLSDPGEIARLAAEMRAVGLRVDWVHAHYNGGSAFFDIRPPFRAQSIASQIHWLRAAAELGARVMVYHPFYAFEFPDPAPPETFDLLRDAFAVIVREARRLGVRPAIENLQNSLANEYTDRLLDALPDLDFCLDAAHAELAGNASRWLPRLGPRLAALHLHDNHGSTDDHLPPGLGRIDWTEWAVRLARVGYGEIWGIEATPPEACDNPEATTRTLAACMDVLRAARAAAEKTARAGD